MKKKLQKSQFNFLPPKLRIYIYIIETLPQPRMESRVIISKDESKQIIQKFFKVHFSFSKLLQLHESKHTDEQVVEHVKKIFTQMILDIERQLMLAGKIKTMQLFENKSEQMFNYLMNLQEILNEEHISDFTIYYRNRVSRVTVYQTDHIPSQKRISIYNAFINYAIDHDLFRFCIPQQEFEQPVQMLEDPMKLYTGQVLQEMYKIYVAQAGNIRAVELKIKKQGKYKIDKYVGASLQQNIHNLYLIGLYRLYKAAMRKSSKPCSGWQTFTAKHQSALKRLQFPFLKILFRVAVYDNATTPEITDICKAMRKRLVPQIQLETRKNRQSHEQKQRFYNALKGEMQKIIKEQ